jgi:hypothetical protein
VLCEHLEALGQLGHTAHRLQTLGSRAVCDAAITSNARALSRELLAGAGEETLRATACSATCGYADEGGLRGELRHWPAALQLLLDQDDALLSASLASEDNLLVAEGSGASSALLLLATTRSDGLVVRALCALGACERALAEAPSAEALASMLALAAFEGSGGSNYVARCSCRDHCAPQSRRFHLLPRLHCFLEVGQLCELSLSFLPDSIL